MILKALIVFLAVTFADGLWTLYIIATAKNRILLASSASATIIATGSLVTVEYVKHPILIIPAALGAFVGTYITMKYSKWK